MKVLAVNDKKEYLASLAKSLHDAGFEAVTAKTGEEALGYLASSKDINVIFLSNPELLKTIKSQENFRQIPIILESASNQNINLADSINSGATYQVSNQLTDAEIVSIVRALKDDAKLKASQYEELMNARNAIKTLNSAQFEFKTMEEANALANFISYMCPDPQKALLGLSEIMVNAVEHGNLGISYEEKTELLSNGNWLEEIKRRQEAPENKDKKVQVTVTVQDDEVKCYIKDGGAGFKWADFMEISPDRMTNPNGRGIALSAAASADELEYLGKGNEVVLHFKNNG